jgi:polysaccharide deacetylase family protein (PEP-CTERM system associated)
MQNALTVDVEDYFHVAALSQAIRREDWDSLSPRVERNTHRLLEMFSEAGGIKATFFVLGWVAERFPKLVAEIDREGHEVASHGYSHQLIYEQRPEVFRQETLRSKRLLEDQSGKAVIGYRAASYSITSQSLWALDTIIDAGFSYDSSVVPVRHDLYGVPGSQAFPHMLEAPSGRSLAEFPPSTYRCFGVSIPVGGGGYFRLYPYRLTAFFLRRLNQAHRQPFIFYLHPWEIDPSQPRVQAKARSRFRHYINLDRTEPRLQRLLKDFEFGSVSSVLRQLHLIDSQGGEELWPEPAT